MSPNDKPQFLALLQTIAEYFNQPLEEDVAFLYWHTLKDLPWEMVKQAFIAHLQNPTSGKWMPKAADILNQLQNENLQQGRVAWEKVEQAICHIGRYDDVAFDDPIIHIVIKRMGGWIKLCGSLRDELPIYRKRFEQLYQQVADQNLNSNEYPRFLAGLMSSSGTTPVLIGDQSKAKAIAKGDFKAGTAACQNLKLVQQDI